MIDDLKMIPKTLVSKIVDDLNILNSQSVNDDYKLSVIYKAMDEINVINEDVFTCSRGCSHCCKIDVSITGFEAYYIQMKTGNRLNSKISLSFNNTSDCPFLKKNSCSIYQHRPFVCRAYHSLGNPIDCFNRNNIQYQYGTILSDWGNPIFKQMYTYISLVNTRMNGKIFDIRDYFK